MVECEEAAFELLVPHEQFAEAVEPAMADLDNPAPRPPLRVAPFVVGLLAAVDNMRNVTVAQDHFHCSLASIARVGTQVFVAPLRRRLALDHDGLEHRIDLGDVVLIGPGHDDR